jgi:hypothetical protein
MTDDGKGSDVPGQQGEPGQPSEAELNAMSGEELVALGGRLDGVETVFKEPRWPVAGTKAEKRAERLVAIWLLLGGLLGFALLLVFLFWPWEYQPEGSSGNLVYSLATPLYGLTFGGSVLCIAVGAVLFQKRFIPEAAPQDGGRELERRVSGFHPASTQADRPVVGREPRRVRARHPGGVCRGPDQEPVETGGADR